MVVLPAKVIVETCWRSTREILNDMVDYPVDGPDDDFVQGIESPGLFRVYDPGDNVFTVADLAVEVSMLRKHASRNEIYQLPVNGRGADIDGYREVSAGGVSGFYVDDMAFPAFENRPVEGHGNFEARFSQYPRNLANDRKPHHQPVFIVFSPRKLTRREVSARLSMFVGSGSSRYLFSTGGIKRPLLFSSSRFIC